MVFTSFHPACYRPHPDRFLPRLTDPGAAFMLVWAGLIGFPIRAVLPSLKGNKRVKRLIRIEVQ